MTYGEGYGRDWTNWDAFIQHKWPKPKDVKYNNWCPFLSPNGVWMAFYNTNYGDIRIVNLETNETVVSDFYSRIRGYEKDHAGNFIKDKNERYITKPDHVYDGGHCNYSTYVPHCLVYHFWHEHKNQGTWLGNCLEDYEFDECLEDYEFDEFDPNNPEKIFNVSSNTYKMYNDTAKLIGIPLAFNAHTYWAADFDFQTDIIDLSDVDNGNIRLYDKSQTQFTIPRSAENVRNFVNFQPEVDQYPENISVYANFSILEETKCHRFYSKGYDNEPNQILMDANIQKEEYVHEELLPWQKTKIRMEEYEKSKK